MYKNLEPYHESIIVNEISDNVNEIESILSDFDKLKLSGGPCTNENDINYNDGKEANPFDKIAKYYGRNGNVFQFLSVLRDKEVSEKIMKIIGNRYDTNAKEKFIERVNIYLLRISSGEKSAKEFLSNDEVVAFFNGYHVSSPGHDRNIYENLNINVTKPGCVLETSDYFKRIIKTIEVEKSHLRRVKIYNNGKRIATVLKNENQQRSYSFNKFARCDVEIGWNAKDETGKFVKCLVGLHVASGEVKLKSSKIDGEYVDSHKILELAKQNAAILIKNKTLHHILLCCDSFVK